MLICLWFENGSIRKLVCLAKKSGGDPSKIDPKIISQEHFVFYLILIGKTYQILGQLQKILPSGDFFREIRAHAKVKVFTISRVFSPFSIKKMDDDERELVVKIA